MGNKAEFLGGLLLGALVGAALGLLFAPYAGEQTRTLIKEKAGDVAESASSGAKTLVEKGKGLLQRGREDCCEGTAEEAASN